MVVLLASLPLEPPPKVNPRREAVLVLLLFVLLICFKLVLLASLPLEPPPKVNPRREAVLRLLLFGSLLIWSICFKLVTLRAPAFGMAVPSHGI